MASLSKHLKMELDDKFPTVKSFRVIRNKQLINDERWDYFCQLLPEEFTHSDSYAEVTWIVGKFFSFEDAVEYTLKLARDSDFTILK